HGGRPRELARPHRRLQLPGAGADGLLRQQGRLPACGARADGRAGSRAVTDVDDIRIAFDEGSLTTLRIVLGLILLGVALDTRISDFRRAIRRPWAILVAVFAQFLVLPAITFVLTLA